MALRYLLIAILVTLPRNPQSVAPRVAMGRCGGVLMITCWDCAGKAPCRSAFLVRSGWSWIQEYIQKMSNQELNSRHEWSGRQGFVDSRMQPFERRYCGAASVSLARGGCRRWEGCENSVRRVSIINTENHVADDICDSGREFNFSVQLPT